MTAESSKTHIDANHIPGFLTNVTANFNTIKAVSENERAQIGKLLNVIKIQCERAVAAGGTIDFNELERGIEYLRTQARDNREATDPATGERKDDALFAENMGLYSALRAVLVRTYDKYAVLKKTSGQDHDHSNQPAI